VSIEQMFATDDRAARDGVWLDYGKFRILVRYAGEGNEAYLKAMATIHRKHKKAIQYGALANDLARKLLMQVVADTVVVDWDGEIEAGKPAPPCTPEAVLAYFQRFPMFYLDVHEQAQNFGLFRKELLEEESKNS
jgi:hypothetical protein